MRKLFSLALLALNGAMLSQAQEVENGVLNICEKNTSSNYKVYNSPLHVTKDSPLKVYTSRYTAFNSVVTGDGELSMYCGGERTFLGDEKGNTYPSWSGYTGDFHVYPYKEVEPNAGFYGVVLCSGGKTFNPEDIEGSLQTTNSQLMNNRVFLHDGATLATNTGVRGARIGEINMEPGSRIYGSIKASSKNGSFLTIGGMGTDAVLAGQIASANNDLNTPLGLIKEGAGTYRITGNDNLITGAIRVLEGKVLINNDAAAAKASKLKGGIGVLGDNVPGMYVFKDATAGGTGNSGSLIDLYGNLEPGDNGIGTFTLADYANGKNVALRLRPTSRIYFEIASAEDYDRLNVSGNLDYYNIGQDFAESSSLPIVYIVPTEGNGIQVGDEFTLITAKGKSARDNAPWNFRIQYPKSYTWEVTETEENGAYKLVAKVVSLEYGGQGDETIDDDSDLEGDEYEVNLDELMTKERAYIRQYADVTGKRIGVAVRGWEINLDNESQTETKTISREFNIVVCENEMKFDATEPSRGNFSFGDGDRLTNFAARHDIYVRGHALAWHKQCPEWLSSDGGVKNSNNFSRTELLGILKNHIDKVVGHYKGKVHEWDVVNECLSDNQSAIRSNPNAYDLRQSIWYTGIGEDSIDSAFVWTHRADPDAKLYLNDYGVEFKGIAKTEALFNLAKRLKDSGIPIDGVGLQCHLDVTELKANKLAATIEKFATIGLNCIITELDLGLKNYTGTDGLERQAYEYAQIAKVVTKHDNCPNMVIWGYSDNLSWREGSQPLLFNESGSRKPAYYATRGVFRLAANDVSTNISEPSVKEEDVKAVRYYNLQGQEISAPQSGLLIVAKQYADGSVKAEKRYMK